MTLQILTLQRLTQDFVDFKIIETQDFVDFKLIETQDFLDFKLIE